MPSIVHTVSTCSQCGAPLENVEPFDKECRQILDFLALCFFVLEHCAEHKRCPAPATPIRAHRPKNARHPGLGAALHRKLRSEPPAPPEAELRRRGPTITVILPHERATPQLLTCTERGFPL